MQQLTTDKLRLLEIPPAPTEYATRSDGKIFLAKDYYFRKANEIFGIGNWAVHHDCGSVRYETHLHPKTNLPVGVVCYVQTTLTTQFSMPRTVVGFGAVQFGKNNGVMRDDQNVDVYVLALRSAEARGLKDALSTFGVAFQVDMTGGKKNPRPTQNTSNIAFKPPIPRQEETRTATRPGQGGKPQSLATSKVPSHEKVEPNTGAVAVKTGAGNEVISPEQLARVKMLAQEKGYIPEGLEALCQQRMKRSSTEMSQPQAVKLIEFLEKQPAVA